MKKQYTQSKFILFSLFLLSMTCKKDQNLGSAQSNATTVEIQEIAYSKALIEETFPATISASKQIDLRTDISGTLEGILFKEGGYVKKGQILYIIDKSRYQAAYDNAVAQLRIAEANLNRVQTDAKRYQNLWAHDAIEKIKLDHALSMVKVAQAQVDVDRATVKRMKTDLSHSTVKAPFSGYAGVSQARLGDLIIANQTVLTTLAEKKEMRADIFIPDVMYVQLSRENKKTHLSSAFTLILPDGVEYPQNGRLEFIDNKVDPQTGTLRIRLAFPNPDGDLKPGMNCIVKVKQPHEGQEKVLLINQKAIREVLGQNFVFVIDNKNQVVEKEITLGQTIGNKQIVKSGLQAGEKIVVEGIQKIKQGDIVKTKIYKDSDKQASP